jgi:nucleotide-binding universal stress UspA family protein
MIATILVPLDGSSLAERALPSAQQAARVFHATVHLVRVTALPPGLLWSPVPTYIPSDATDRLLEQEEEKAAQYLAEVRHRLQAAGVQVATHQLIGHAGAALADFEETQQIDLVVMASHGRSGLSRLAFGSVAGHLLHHGHAPLLLVRAFGIPSNLDRVVVPLDGSSPAEAALDAITDLAPLGIREVTLLRVVDTERHRQEAGTYLETVARRLPDAVPPPVCKVLLGDQAQLIIAEAGDAKTVVMATHGRAGPARRTRGSVADAVACGAHTSVLLLPEGSWAAHRPAATGDATQGFRRKAPV